jgi:hypothetical protein
VFELQTAEKRPLNGHVSVDVGPYYNGDLTTIEAGLTVRPSSFLTLEGTLEQNFGTVTAVVDQGGVDTFRDADIDDELYGLHIALNFSPSLQITSLTQYDSQSQELGSNNRLRWTFAPSGDLFVVYNHNLEQAPNNHWRFVSNELPVKLQYTWRF